MYQKDAGKTKSTAIVNRTKCRNVKNFQLKPTLSNKQDTTNKKKNQESIQCIK